MDNTKNTTIDENNIVKLEKSANISIATVGDIINYKLIVSNNTQMDIFDVIVEDLLDSNISFVKGTVKIEGMSLINESILTGVNLGNLVKGTSKVVTFDALVINASKIYAENIAKGSYNFITNFDGQKGIETIQSNTNKVLIETYEIKIEKSVDKEKVYLGDIVSYYIEIINNGEKDALNILLKDKLPVNVEIIEGSFTVNDEVINSVSLDEGIRIGDLKAKEKFFITYQVEVISGLASSYMINEAFAQFNYKLSNGVIRFGETKIVKAVSQVGIASFKQMDINKEFCLLDNKLDIKEIEEVLVDIDFFDSYVVKVNENVSYERQVLTRNKLIVHGYMRISAKYTALCKRGSVHLAEWKLPFSNFIMLPNSYIDGSEIEIVEDIESIEYDLICKRCISVGINCLLMAIIKN